MNNKRTLIIAAGFVLALVLASCGPSTLNVTVKAGESGGAMSYDPVTLTAQVGQPVSIKFENVGALEHTFLIDELNVKSDKVQPGQTATLTFTPDTAGTYMIYCDVLGHKEAGMVGTLTVNP
ncbi:MAG: cupredoxin domain-containing protein [Anaerolineales bacterium]